MLNSLFVIVILVYLLSILFPQLNLDFLLSILCIIVVFTTMFRVKRFVKILGTIFLLLGFSLLLISDAHSYEYVTSFGPMLDLITMFTLLPILGIPIMVGSYSDEIQALIYKKVKTFGQLYMMTSGLSYVLSIFMNLAAMPMVYHSISPSLDGRDVKNKAQFMSKAITHGYAMPLMWAPVTPIVGIVISVTEVNWLSIILYILPLSIFGLALDWYLGTRGDKRGFLVGTSSRISGNETAATIEKEPVSLRRVFHIVFAILIFNIAISIAEFQLPYSFLILVSLLVIPFAFTWSLLLDKRREFHQSLKSHFSFFSTRMQDQFFIYLSAGFFISTINISHTNVLLNDVISQVKVFIGAEAFIILLPLIPLMFAFIGLHPAVTVALMAEALNPSTLGISPIILTVAMLAGAVSAFLMGPYNATIGLMSSIVKVDSFKVSRWNRNYTVLYLLGVMVYLFLLECLHRYNFL